MKITVYSKNNCVACETAKGFLTNEGVTFEVKNISENDQYMQEVLDMGLRSMPIIVNDQNDTKISGFEIDKIEALVEEYKSN